MIKPSIQKLIDLEILDELADNRIINMTCLIWLNYMEYYIQHIELGYSKTESKKRTINRFNISAKTFYKAKKALVISN